MYIYLIVAILISLVPVIRSMFGTIHTLVHESGHALAALITSGKVYAISLYKTTDGLAITSSKSKVRSIFVSYAGYTFATIVAYFSFYFISTGETLFLFYFFLGLATVNLLLWVRNVFGVFWLLLYVGGCGLLIHFQFSAMKQVLVYILASVILVQSVFASWTVFLLSMKSSGNAGDATGLQKLTHIPAFIWGFLFFAQSLWGTYYILRYFI
ncbi:M50 family metallopeptidase [Halalkalibacter wakoensis]|nr:M50 family metallopeptidase [Halalkalibacter wakoensis]